ncbi:MAG: hypothetical protein ACE5G9_09795 [Nitrospinales bacterium]
MTRNKQVRKEEITVILAYPVTLEPDGEGGVIAGFADVPEAMTVGRDEANALDWAADALVVALSGYLDSRRDIPKPSKPKRGQPVVQLPMLVSLKLMIYQAMCDKNVTQAELAEKLNCDARQVRRLLDLDHQSRMDQIEAALRLLGKKAVIDFSDAA